MKRQRLNIQLPADLKRKLDAERSGLDSSLTGAAFQKSEGGITLYQGGSHELQTIQAASQWT